MWDLDKKLIRLVSEIKRISIFYSTFQFSGIIWICGCVMLSFMNSQNTRTERNCIYNNLQNLHAMDREKNTCFCAIEMDVSN